MSEVLASPSLEEPYRCLVRHVIEHGQPRKDRTGTGTLSVFGGQLRFDLSQGGRVPLLTCKAVPWRSCLRELLWFASGSTDASHLSRQGVRIWDGNSTREFLDARGLGRLPAGDIGAGYGFQWRHFGAEYRTCRDDYAGQGVDQLAYVEHLLKTEPHSRRIFMSAWNPAALEHMALPPCHVSAQFFVDSEGGGLRCHMYQRSADLFLGVPFNIFSYSALTHLLAARCGLRPCELIVSFGDAHLYLDHVEPARDMLAREPLPPPRLVVSPRVADKAWEALSLEEDFELHGYLSHPAIPARMSV